MDAYRSLPDCFVNWKEIPEPGKKPRKVPWDHINNRELDHLNPINWRSYDDVINTSGLFPAFVLGRHGTTPPQYSLFLLDLDNCRDAATGITEQWATDVLGLFTGAFIEVSHSGTGYHVLGYCQPALMGTNRKHRFTPPSAPHNACEWYMDGRFIALGRDGKGDINLDWSNVLVDLIPVKNVTVLPAPSDITTVPPDYTGPDDDDTLLQIIMRDINYDALQPHRIPASAFYGDMESLRRMVHAAYGQDTSKAPPYDYDASSVDMTLANHLAYYTGGNVARMERLFMRSLMGQRDKTQQRPQYVRDTVGEAAGLALRDGRYLKTITPENISDMLRRITSDTDPIIQTIADALSRLSTSDRDGILTEAKRICPKGTAAALTERVTSLHNAFRVQQGQHAFDMLKQGELSNWFIVSNDGGTAVAVDRRGGTSPQSKAAFAESRAYLPAIPVMDAKGAIRMQSAVEAWWIDPETERYEYQSFHPGNPQAYNDEYGRSVRNMYRAPHDMPAVTNGDVEPYMHIMRSNIPNEHDQTMLLSALAFAVQYPGEMLLWAPVMQGAQGSGKGTLIKKPLVHAVGSNLGVAGPKQLTGEYNGYMYRKTTVVVDEIGHHSKATIAEIADSLKEPIAESPVPYRIMRTDPFSGDNFTCWFFLTNHMDSMLANDPNERRYAHFVSMIQTPEQVTRAFPDDWWISRYPAVVQAAGGPGLAWFRYYQFWWEMTGAEAVRAVLENYPAAMPGRAPITSTRQAAESAGEPEMVTQVREAISTHLPGFRGGFISSIAVRELLKSEGLRPPSGRWFNEAMKRLGYVHNQRMRPSPGENMRFPNVNDTQMRVYFIDGNLVGHKPSHILSAYDQAQTVEPRAQENNVVPMKPPPGT